MRFRVFAAFAASAALLLGGGAARAGAITTVPLDLNDFFFFAGDPVTVAPDGSSATIGEFDFFSLVTLTNDPFLGDPGIIPPGPMTSLLFDFEFTEGPDDENEFFAQLLDDLGPVPGFFFGTTSPSAGTVAFDLSSLASLAFVGLQFALDIEIGALDLDSTGAPALGASVTVSNLRLEIEEVMDAPSPGALAILAVGLPAIFCLRRRRRGA